MKRIVLWGLSTLSTLVVLFGYHTSTSSVMATGTGTTISGSLPSAGSATGSATGTSSGAPPTSGGSGGAGGSGAGTSTTTVTGSTAQTRYGPVQVQVDVNGSTITNVSILQYPSGSGRDVQIAQYALPKLIQETLDSQSSHVSMVSGATYTSTGYEQSLQSALDQAGL